MCEVCLVFEKEVCQNITLAAQEKIHGVVEAAAAPFFLREVSRKNCRIFTMHEGRAAGLADHACEQGRWPSPKRNLASLGYLSREQ